MSRLELNGAWYTDALPNGSYAALYGSARIRTYRGNVPLPPGGNLLYLRCAESRGLCLIGQGHDDGRAWLWADAAWHDLGETYGTSPCAFGPDGAYISRPQVTGRVDVFDLHTGQLVHVIARQIGARGIAHVDDNGTPHSVDSWYGCGGFAEYTDLGPVQIGQGAQGGLVARVHDGPLRLVEPGSVQFIRASRDGDRVAIAAWKDVAGGAVIHWLTMAEIAALPLVSSVTEPEPEPEPDPMELPNHLEALEALRAEYPALIDHVQAVEILNRLAWQFRTEGFGLLAKPNGNHGPQPRTGILTSCDWIVNRNGLGTDVFADGPDANTDPVTKGPARAQWGHGEPYDASRFVAPVEPVGAGPGPDPDPEPEPEPGDDWHAFREAVTYALGRMEERLTKLEGPRKVAIRSSRDRYLRDDWGDNTAKFDRDHPGSGEIVTLDPQ